MNAYNDTKIRLRKDGWIPTKPWFADLILANGNILRNWRCNYKTKKALLESFDADMRMSNTLIIRDRACDT